MRWAELLDASLDADASELLAHWDEFAASLVPPRPGPADEFTGADLWQRVSAMREQGWLDFPADADTTDTLYLAAIERFHRRDLPIPVPLIELWSALRLLHRLGTPEARDLLHRTEAGEIVPLLAVGSVFEPGVSGWVPFGAAATVLVAVAAGDGVEIRISEPDAAAASPANAPDPTLPSWAVAPGSAAAGALRAPELAALRGELLLAQSAALTGQAEALMIATTAYLTVRHQFGVPVGSFQALRHRAADLAVEVYAAHRLIASLAATRAEATDPELPGLIAKSFAGAAAVRMASEAVQLHGGIGFTWEGGVHFGLKRIMQLAMTGPTVAECEERLGRKAVETEALTWAGGLDDREVPTMEAAR